MPRIDDPPARHAQVWWTTKQAMDAEYLAIASLKRTFPGQPDVVALERAYEQM